MDEPLDQVGVRVLGALIEKEITTPANYPLTLNSLTAACNQTSNRDPVMELDEKTVSRSLDDLARRSLVRAMHRGDSRVMRYRQEMSQTLHLHEPELAALAVLLLRGPQTAGEIRTRSSRMFQFVDPRHVEITLESLSTLSAPMVAQLPLRRGQKEERYAHLLSGEPPPDTHAEPDASDVGAARRQPDGERIEALEHEVGVLRSEVAGLREELGAFRKQFE
jgi:hypothetical protein